MSLIIWDRVNTPAGKGILTAVYTPGNGLYIDYDNAKCSVYYIFVIYVRFLRSTRT